MGRKRLHCFALIFLVFLGQKAFCDCTAKERGRRIFVRSEERVCLSLSSDSTKIFALSGTEIQLRERGLSPYIRRSTICLKGEFVIDLGEKSSLLVCRKLFSSYSDWEQVAAELRKRFKSFLSEGRLNSQALSFYCSKSYYSCRAFRRPSEDAESLLELPVTDCFGYTVLLYLSDPERFEPVVILRNENWPPNDYFLHYLLYDRKKGRFCDSDRKQLWKAFAPEKVRILHFMKGVKTTTVKKEEIPICYECPDRD